VAGEFVFGQREVSFKLCALASLRAIMFVSPKSNCTPIRKNRTREMWVVLDGHSRRVLPNGLEQEETEATERGSFESLRLPVAALS